MESKPKKELVRIAAWEGELKIDFTGKAPGRGVYVCPDRECILKAEKNSGLKRSLKTDIKKAQLEKLFDELKETEGDG